MADRRRGNTGPALLGGGDASDRRILLVEIPADMVATLPDLSEAAPVSTSYRALNIDLIAKHDPHIVIAPLVGPGFDILDVGAQLLRSGYTGSLRALTTPLPNLAAVRAEVRSHVAGLDFDLVVLSPPAETGH
jgi:hypothetical protein